MTLPKTHPLYGAVEALYKTNRLLTWSTCEDAIRALESAGYRVVGPEPTPEMVISAIEGMSVYGLARSMLAAGIAAAPTITETEKGG